MATIPLNILGAITLPDTSGSVYWEPQAVNAQANDFYPGGCFVFADTSTRIKLGIGFRIPENWISTSLIKLYWYTTVTTGKVVWECDYRSIAAGESMDPSTDQRNVTSTGTIVNGTARFLSVETMTLTDADLAVGDWFEGVIVRDGADTTNDTAAASTYLVGAFFIYNDV